MLLEVDGEYPLELGAVASSTVYVSGSLGGGVLTLGYRDNAGFVPLSDGVLQIGEQYMVIHGTGMHLRVSLTGSIGAAVTVINKGME
jgi:hypothetical protein